MDAETGTEEKTRIGPEIFDTVRFRGGNLAVLHSLLALTAEVPALACLSFCEWLCRPCHAAAPRERAGLMRIRVGVSTTAHWLAVSQDNSPGHRALIAQLLPSSTHHRNL